MSILHKERLIMTMPGIETNIRTWYNVEKLGMIKLNMERNGGLGYENLQSKGLQ